MSKWADYCISAVRFNARHTHIDRVKGWIDNGEDTLGDSFEGTRQQVIASIEAGYTFATIRQNANGKWDKGARVFVVMIHGQQFIKTRADNTTADNLDNLPEY